MVTAIVSGQRARLPARLPCLPLLCLLLALTGCQTFVAHSSLVPPPTPPLPAADPQFTISLPDETTPGGTRLVNPAAMREFYRARRGAPAWQRPEHPDLAAQLLAAIRGSAAEGLTPAAYHLQALEGLDQTTAADHRHVVEQELLRTDAFLTLASHYRYGRLNLQAILPEWQPQLREENLGALLESALAGGTIAATLHGLLPQAPGYRALKEALARLRRMADQDGWPAIPGGSRMQRGDHGPRVVVLRQRLAVSGDLPAETAPAGDRFDDDAEAAVRRFQARHGLKADGVVEQKTLKALNVPAERRIQQLTTNLERWRWLPRTIGNRDIVVNIPGFSLTVLENQQPLLTMKVVAGRSDRQTPVYSSTVTHLVLNPTWEVPREIASKDLLPKIRKDPTYLQRLGFRVLTANGGNGRELDPAQIDWRAVTPTAFRYHLSQKPGKDNFLGQVKFLFPNPYSVYLHDTPSKNLFQKESRPFSSGCVRLERPLDLAALLLRDTALGSREGLNAALASKATRTVRLPAPIPVHLIYLTAWLDDDGALQLRPDLYGYDRLIEEGLAGLAVRKPLPCIGGCGE
ncbi:MAG: L,D-transpeptidase family protein [Thermodesulfobacteriota bacterium]